jgi:hypothetical protein
VCSSDLELKSFYTACQAYFADNPGTTKCAVSTVSATFQPSPQVKITDIPDGQEMIGTKAKHDNGPITYEIVGSGNISP